MSAPTGGALLDGRYELLDELDRGGMATVFRARDRRLDRLVAIKVLADARRDDAGIAFREDRLTARLAHPHIVAVYDGGRTPEGRPFLVMELIDGRAVSHLDPLSAGQALRIGEDVASAVAYTHEQGVVHCDIKPQNILLDAHGQAKLADFGVASADSAPSGEIVYGSAPYLAPERLRGAPVGPAVDIYALGATLYFLLSGRPPYDGQTGAEVIARAQAGPPRPLAEIVPNLPRGVEAIVRRAMARDPADRYPTAAALRDDLAELRRSSGQTTTALRIIPDLAAPAVAPWASANTSATSNLAEPPSAGSPPSATTTVLPPGPPTTADPESARRDRDRGRGDRARPHGAWLASARAQIGGMLSRAARRSAAWLSRAVEPGRHLRRRLPVPGHWLVVGVAALLILLVLVAGLRTLIGLRTNAASSGATIEVPTLVGLDIGTARERLRAGNLTLGRVDAAPLPGQPPNVVVYQEPSAGIRVEPGTAIDIVIRTAP